MFFDYELIDCGDLRRLERFGTVILDRPAPQAMWPKKLLRQEWDKADAVFIIDDKNKYWKKNRELDEFWTIKLGDATVQLSFLEQGQIGIFPEQYPNWVWIKNILSKNKAEVNLLNGFAYTGIASLVSAVYGKKDIKICNVDALQSAINFLKNNLFLSNADNKTVRVIVDDILTFLNREHKRGSKYDVFIFDPPAFGRFQNKIWSISKDFSKLVELMHSLTSEHPLFIILSCHDERFDRKILGTYLLQNPTVVQKYIEYIDLTIKSTKGNSLPAGFCVRYKFN